MQNPRIRTHTVLFRTVSTLVFLTMLLTTVSSALGTDDSILSNIVSQLTTLIFGSSTSTSTTTGTFSGAGTDTTSGRDPSPNPPPKP